MPDGLKKAAKTAAVGVGAAGIATAIRRPDSLDTLVNNAKYFGDRITSNQFNPDTDIPMMGSTIKNSLDVTGNDTLIDELGIGLAAGVAANYIGNKLKQRKIDNQRLELAKAKVMGQAMRGEKSDMAEGFDIKRSVGDITMHNQYSSARKRALNRGDINAVRRLDDAMREVDDTYSSRLGTLGLAGAGGTLGALIAAGPKLNLNADKLSDKLKFENGDDIGNIVAAGLVGASTGMLLNLAKSKKQAESRDKLRKLTEEDSFNFSVSPEGRKISRDFAGGVNINERKEEKEPTYTTFKDVNAHLNTGRMTTSEMIREADKLINVNAKTGELEWDKALNGDSHIEVDNKWGWGLGSSGISGSMKDVTPEEFLKSLGYRQGLDAEDFKSHMSGYDKYLESLGKSTDKASEAASSLDTPVDEGIGLGAKVALGLAGAYGAKKLIDAYRGKKKRNVEYDTDPVTQVLEAPRTAQQLSFQKAGLPARR